MKLHGPLRRARTRMRRVVQTFLAGDSTSLYCHLLAKRSLGH